MKKLYTSKMFLNMAGGTMHIAYPLFYPPGSAPGPKLQKPSKESGIFQSLGTITCSFLLKGRVKRGAIAQCSPKYAPGDIEIISRR